MPRVVSLSPLTWSSGMSRNAYAVVRAARRPRGMPAVVVSLLDGLAPGGMTFATLDLAVQAQPEFWIQSFRTGQGAMRRDGRPPAEGYYLFRHGLVIAHHPGGSHADAQRVAQYLREKLVDASSTRSNRRENRWVQEDQVRPGAGWRGGGTGGRDPRRGYADEEAEDEPRVHHRDRRRTRAPAPPPEPDAPDPYTVLGVSRSDDEATLRKAYKNALKMNHPDRVAHLSPALQAFALAQTQAIREAWETIKEERGF